MSWWISEHIAVNEDETQQLCSIEADTQSSLPAVDQTSTAGFIIVRGSVALVLDTGDTYKLNSGGTWVQQPSGVRLDLTGYATEQYVDDGLAAKVDTTTYTADQAAQNAQISAKATVSDIYGLPPTSIVPADGTTDTLASYILPGSYVIPTAVAAGRITDSPITDKGYRMEVKQYRSGSYYRQTIMAWNEPAAFYTRSRQGGASWTAWYKFEGSQI